MKTYPIYLENPYLKEMEATVVDVLPESTGIFKVLLNQTIFYPMGGGQPTDQGFLIFSDGSKGEVYQVLLKDGEIVHYVKATAAPLMGQKVSGYIDWVRRYKNMKVHSGGHLIDFAMYLLGYTPSLLRPCKGDHGKKPFVVYSGVVDKDIKERLQAAVDDLIAKDLPFSWSFASLETLEKEAIYLQPGLPQNKPLRALRLHGIGVVADGGTIVSSTREVGKVSLVTVETNDKETLVRYLVE